MLTKAGFDRLEAALAPQPYIILRNGIIENDPDNLPILNLDVLEDDYIDDATIVDVRALRAQATDLHLPAIVAECDIWLARHDPTSVDVPGAQA